MITREALLDAIEEDCELEKLVYEYGGVDKAVASMNIFVPVFESILKGVTNFVEEFQKGFNKSREERLDKSFIDEVEEDESLFKKALAMCDVDVEWRYNYLDDLLCKLTDESMELYEEAERAQIDEEIAQRLIDDYGFDARNELINANIRRVELQKELEKIEYKIEATNDLYDECLFGIYQNYDDVAKMNENNEAVADRLFFGRIN